MDVRITQKKTQESLQVTFNLGHLVYLTMYTRWKGFQGFKVEGSTVKEVGVCAEPYSQKSLQSAVES